MDSTPALRLKRPLIQVEYLEERHRRLLYRLKEAGEVRQLAPTVYIREKHWRQLSRKNKSLGKAASYVASSKAKNRILAGNSAAVAQGIPLVGWEPYDGFDVIAGRNITTKGLVCRSLHSAATTTLAHTSFGDIPATDHLTTCIDLGRWHGLEEFIVAAEHCLHNRLFSKQDILDRIDRMPHARGIHTLRRALPLINHLSESPRESQWKLQMHQRGMEPPFQQAEIFDPYGNFIARVDFFWPVGLAGEYDGQVKYDHEDPKLFASTLDAERRRERALLNEGIVLVRADADSFRTGEALDRLAFQHDRLSDEQRSFPAAQFIAAGPAWT